MKTTKYLTFLVIIVLLASGCASTQKKEVKKLPYIFYPEPPAPPRIQYLKFFTTNKDVEPPESEFERFVTGQRERIRFIDKPYGVAMYDGKIYVCDTNNKVMVFDLKEKKFHAMEGSAKGLGKVLQPLNIAIDKDGTKYVADPVRGQVLVYDKDDFYLKAFGSPAQWIPIDVAILGNRLYVVNRLEKNVWIVDKNTGELIDKIGQKGDNSNEWLGLPTNIAIGPKGYLYITDLGRFQVVKFDRDGHFKGTIGKLGTSPGHFARPRGVALDRKGRIYVVDAAFDNIQIFNNKGRLLMFFGKPGQLRGDMYLPAKVYIDYDNIKYFKDYIHPDFKVEYLILVTNQFGPQKVSVYAMGKMKGLKYPTDKEILEKLEQLKKKILEKQQKKKKSTR